MKSITERITPERERELWERIADFLNGRFSDGDLYNILHHILGMSHTEMEALGFAFRDYYEEE